MSGLLTGALLARRATLARGADPALRCGEDVNLIWRIHDQGWRIRDKPAATWTARTLRRAEVPPTAAIEFARRGVVDSAVATGRAKRMLALAALAAGLVRRWTAPAAFLLLLTEPDRSWKRSQRRLDAIRWTALAIADDVVGRASVRTGALRTRTTAPLRPAMARGVDNSVATTPTAGGRLNG